MNAKMSTVDLKHLYHAGLQAETGEDGRAIPMTALLLRPLAFFTMTERLSIIASKIPFGKGVIDVGTDHGYIPVWLAKEGYPGNIYASDINPGPLEVAKTSARDAGVYDRIKFSLSDGLSECRRDMIDTIVIAGMGGDTICRILDVAEWCTSEDYTLILQPMTKVEILRYWLTNNDFAIREEEYVSDGGAIYPILTVSFGRNKVLSDGELFSGERAKAENRELYEKNLDILINRFEKAMTGLYSALVSRNAKEAFFGNILTELKEIKHDVQQ